MTQSDQLKNRNPFSNAILWMLKQIPYVLEDNSASARKFKHGDILILKNRKRYGYGIRPIMVVNSYSINKGRKGRQGFYNVTVYKDDLGGRQNFYKWRDHNEVSSGVERIVEEHDYNKLIIDLYFKKVPSATVDEALALYASKEV